MRPQRVVELEADRMKVAILAHVVGRGVGVEDEGGVVARARRIVQAAVPKEDAREPLRRARPVAPAERSEEHTSELQSLAYLVCRLLLEKKNKIHRAL